MKLFDRLRSSTASTKAEAGHISYAQCGEDLIMYHSLIYYLNLEKPSYLDIGAHHASHLSNTYLFYQKGSTGVCVEPDPFLFSSLSQARERDVCLNVGVGFSGTSAADFYVMSCRTLNTFSKSEAERYQGYGTHKIQEVIQVPLLSVNEIVDKYFDSFPDFISLDVEGMDLEILQSFDFSRFRPAALCVETVTYAEDNTQHKLVEILELMKSNGYIVYADTYINTIFVETGIWNKRLTS